MQAAGIWCTSVAHARHLTGCREGLCNRANLSKAFSVILHRVVQLGTLG